MLVFHDPATAAALTMAGGGVSAGGSILQGFANRNAARAEANDLKVQAGLEATAVQRDIRDEQLANKRSIARTRALLSAGGADVGTIIGLTAAQGTESLVRQGRMSADSSVRRETLLTRAKNTRQAADAGLTTSILGGAGTSLSSTAMALKR